MDTNKRRQEIEAIISEQGEITVKDIMNKYDISNVTVRNDLIYLERKGVIRRKTGKAVLKNNYMLSSIDKNIIDNIEEKEKIGKRAAEFINDNDSVMIYTGTTTLQIPRFIDPLIKFIAVTNSIYIAYELCRGNPGVNTVLIGGNCNPQTGSTYGQQSINQLNTFNIDKLFLAVDGIDPDSGITNAQPYETDINRAMIKKANTVIVTADYTKIGKASFVKMGEITEVDILITDSKASPECIKQIEDKGVEVIIV